MIDAGIYAMPAEQYHADPAPEPSLSNSIIRTMLQQTPRHAWVRHPRLNPQWQPEEDSEKFDLGTAAHSLLLEGVDLAVVVDAEDWRSKAAQQARDAAREAGKLPMLPDQHAAVMAMIGAAHEYIDSTPYRGIFSRGKSEQTILWRDSDVWCRGRLDFLSDDRELILDYKTTVAEGPGEFIRNMVRHGYDTQSVFYPRGLAALGHRSARFVFLVQETAAPYLCYLVESAESMVELASHKLARALPLWRDCLKSNRWPSYSTAVHQADAPVWAIKEEELMT